MTKFEDNIKDCFEDLQSKCPRKSICQNACYCRSLSEVLGYHRSVLPKKYINLEISDFTGKVEGKQMVPLASVRSAVSSFMTYCFNDDTLTRNTLRSKLNTMSVMDKRFTDGTSVFVHGAVEMERGVNTHRPLGRSLLAALVLKEAIWRRMFKGNRAISYRFISIHDLIGEVFDRDKPDSSWLTDWLVVDDIELDEKKPIANVLDQVVSRRRGLNLPTILVLQFDAESIDLQRAIGQMAAKLYFDTDTSHQMRLG
jgi:hypothetical protein